MSKKIFLLAFVFFIVSEVLIFPVQQAVHASPALHVTVATNKNEYYLRESVNIRGTLNYSDGSPVADGLVAVEVRPASLDAPITYRTLPTGKITFVRRNVEIVDIVPCDNLWASRQDIYRINPYPSHTYAYFNVTVRNIGTVPQNAFVTVSIYDGNMVPIGTIKAQRNLDPSELWVLNWKIEIPYWAHIGNAKAFANVYTNPPRYEGVPYDLEKSVSFKITRNPEFLGLQPKFYNGASAYGAVGTFNMTFKLSPEPIPGDYSVYVTARKADWILEVAPLRGAAFEVNPTFTWDQSYPPSPPQASFTYIPLRPHKNETVTFDASASSAEGFNDTIVSYKWTWGDGKTNITTSPTITHAFSALNIYTVGLNVTDSEGLWSFTSKPVTVYPPDPPVAEFTWYLQPVVNQNATLDASLSKPGWDGYVIPIANYTWDFGDGNIATVSVPTISHIFTASGNYTVSLTVIDSSGLNDTVSKIVEVLESGPIGDINKDGIVDISDLVLLISAWGSYPGHPKWNPNADLNNDGLVDITDLVLLISNWGAK